MAKIKKPLSYIITGESISVAYDSKNYLITKKEDKTRYDAMRAALVKGDVEAFLEALLTSKRVMKYAGEYFSLDEEGNVYMNDDYNEKLPSVLASRLVEFSREGLPIEPLVYFWKKLRLNPSDKSKQQLYEFLEKNRHPITANGNFIAYKKVTKIGNKLVDSHTKKIDNSVGAVVDMPRDKVVADPKVTCARGLHAASWDYAQGYSGNVLVEVIIDPRDVVSVPVDYNQQKMRICKYMVSCIVSTDAPHSVAAKLDVDDSKLAHKVDASAVVDSINRTVDFTALTAKEIIDVTCKVCENQNCTQLRNMSLKNKSSIVNLATKMLANEKYNVKISEPKKRGNS